MTNLKVNLKKLSTEEKRIILSSVEKSWRSSGDLIVNFSAAVFVEVVQMDETLRGRGQLFRSKDRFTLNSEAYPEMDYDTLFLLGSRKEDDHKSGKKVFNTVAEACTSIDRATTAIAAFNEMNGSIGTPKELIVKLLLEVEMNVEGVSEECRDKGLLYTSTNGYKLFSMNYGTDFTPDSLVVGGNQGEALASATMQFENPEEATGIVFKAYEALSEFNEFGKQGPPAQDTSPKNKDRIKI